MTGKYILFQNLITSRKWGENMNRYSCSIVWLLHLIIHIKKWVVYSNGHLKYLFKMRKLPPPKKQKKKGRRRKEKNKSHASIKKKVRWHPWRVHVRFLHCFSAFVWKGILDFFHDSFMTVDFIWDRITYLASLWYSAYGLSKGVPVANIQRDWHALLHGWSL